MALAETASIFCETLLFEHAAANARDDVERLALLDVHLVGATQTVVDIHSRFLFESELCARRRRTTLSVADMKAAMLDAQEAAYGDGLDPAHRHEYMWAVKGHYFTPFYNWPYTFGLLFGIGLYARYVDDPEKFRSGYDDLLSTVGMADAATLARPVRVRRARARLLEREPGGAGAAHRRLRTTGARMTTRNGHLALARVGIAIAVMCSGVVALGAPAGAAAPAWRVVPTAPGTLFGHLNSVSCPAASICFAVGEQDSPAHVFKVIERWNGKKWTAVKSPSQSGAISSSLSSVFCRTASSCVAVGQYNTLTVTRTLILHWNGKVWSQKSSPNPPNMPVSLLSGVYCTTTTDCFAVGSAFVSTADSSAQSTLIEHWDGVSWTIVPSPNQPSAFDSQLAGVACPSATTCYAVGSYEIQNLTNTLVEAWDGATWTIMPSPNPAANVFNSLAGVSCTGVTSCFAVGSGHGSLTMQLSDAGWSIVTSPNPDGRNRGRARRRVVPGGVSLLRGRRPVEGARVPASRGDVERIRMVGRGSARALQDQEQQPRAVSRARRPRTASRSVTSGSAEAGGRSSSTSPDVDELPVIDISALVDESGISSGCGRDRRRVP